MFTTSFFFYRNTFITNSSSCFAWSFPSADTCPECFHLSDPYIETPSSSIQESCLTWSRLKLTFAPSSKLWPLGLLDIQTHTHARTNTSKQHWSPQKWLSLPERRPVVLLLSAHPSFPTSARSRFRFRWRSLLSQGSSSPVTIFLALSLFLILFSALFGVCCRLLKDGIMVINQTEERSCVNSLFFKSHWALQRQ